ncbi:MAG: hypothetical protein SGI84_00150 [Gemmatimonadota bacterium]|nr:hypothetical protein [Gemmatimonadota bacterium]
MIHSPPRAPRILSAIILTVLWAVSLSAQVPDSSILAGLHWRSIGPMNMGGRVVDIEAVESDFRRVFLASASGGVFRSDNAGTTWQPVFDQYPSLSIGDIALFQPNPDILWVGTGEANNRNSVGWGDGIWKSVDGGKAFTNMGLRDTRQIARVVTHPSNSDIVYVAAIGNLWGYSGDRGLFKTTDGGRSWTKLTTGLPDDGKHGATDLLIDPSNPETLYVAFYHRLRQPWHFQSGGPLGGIYKSTDGGQSWRKLTSGLPAGETGRIGLAISRSNPRVVMALVEAEASTTLARPGSGIYRSEDAGTTWRYVNTYNNRPFYYSNIRINPVNDQRVYVLTTRFMVSSDGGRTLTNGSADEEIHGDFHALWLDPTAADRYYIGADKGASLTHDHGTAFQLFDNLAISQYYRLGVDMRDPYYVYGGHQDNGTWGGPSFSRDARGILNDANWKVHWGDGMDIQVDPTDWRRIYSTAENGKVRRYDALSYRDVSIAVHAGNVTNWTTAIATDTSRSRIRFNWAGPVVMSPHDPKVVYLGGNHLFRTANAGATWTAISPDLSRAIPDRIVTGRSGGITLDNTGAEIYGTITTISESPLRPGVIWVGTDDGNIQLTRNGGQSWTSLRANFAGPAPTTWVGRIEASHFEPGTAYATLEGYREDDMAPWIFRTTDYGATWANITANIPAEHVVHLVREDLRNPDLLFAGTEFGQFASLDRGATWHRLGANLPHVNIQDLVIHPRQMDLVAGTHGRGIWILDDITPLQQLTAEVRRKPAHLFEQAVATLWENRSRGGQRGHASSAGENPATFQSDGSLPRVSVQVSALVSYWLGQRPAGPVTLEISSLDGRQRHRATLPGTAGLQRYAWDLRFDAATGSGRGTEAMPGTYRLTLSAGAQRSVSTLTVRADPILAESPW